MESFESKKEYIKERLAEVEKREPDDISDLTLTEYAFIYLESESDYDAFIDFLKKNPNADTLEITCFLLDLEEQRQ